MEATLARYWTARYGENYRVKWNDRDFFSPSCDQRPAQQKWYCNKWLNVVFTAGVESIALDPIRKEFSHSLRRWRRPIQSAYVALATSPWMSRFFAHATMDVTPQVDGYAHQIIVPGNHKIRVLDHRRRVSTAILKVGFPNDRFQQEINARRFAQELGVPAPHIIEVDEDAGWFSENYVSGTPLNRVTERNRIANTVQKVCESLAPLSQQSLRVELFADYVNRLLSSARGQIASLMLLDAGQRESLEKCVDRLVEMVNANSISGEIDANVFRTAVAHGDLQPANVLLDDEGYWLIDWEYSRRRQLGYDFLVLGLEARCAKGRLRRFEDFVRNGRLEFGVDQIKTIPELDWSSKPARRQALVAFLAEELQFCLEENSNSQFTRIGLGLSCLLEEFNSMMDILRT